MKSRALLIFVIISMLLCSCAQQTPIEEQFQDVLDQAVDKHDIQGVSAAVIFPDGSVWNGVSGISHEGVPIAPEMVFAIGSATKNIVAALTLRLAEEGVLSLDAPLSSWLPPYAHVDGNITIRQLLNHTSGIYNYFDNQELWDDLMAERTRYFTPDEVLAYLEEPYFAAGEGWRYSNTNYLLLAMIITEATGSDLSSALEAYLYQPLSLSGFYLSQEDTLPPNQAHVYGDNWDGGPVRDITFVPRTSHESIIYGAGGIFTTAENLARWSKALFEGRVLEQRSLEEMLTLVKFKPVSTMRAYGLGVLEYRKHITLGELALGHDGANIGTTTSMAYLPDHQISIVVMINAFPNDSAEAVLNGLIKVILKDAGDFGISAILAAYPQYFLVASSAAAYWAVFLTLKIRKKRRSQPVPDHNQTTGE